jgi:hypothetical protein
MSAVKEHLRSMAEKFGLRDVPQTHKRYELVARVFRAGVLIDRAAYPLAPDDRALVLQ